MMVPRDFGSRDGWRVAEGYEACPLNPVYIERTIGEAVNPGDAVVIADEFEQSEPEPMVLIRSLYRVGDEVFDSNGDDCLDGVVLLNRRLAHMGEARSAAAWRTVHDVINASEAAAAATANSRIADRESALDVMAVMQESQRAMRDHDLVPYHARTALADRTRTAPERDAREAAAPEPARDF